MRISTLGFLITALALYTPCAAKTLATVDGKAITEVDVSAFLGYVPSGAALREATEALVEREIILSLARSKALSVSSEEVSRAVTLAARAHLPPAGAGGTASRQYIAEELLISKYIDLYVYPRIKADEKTLTAYFVDHAGNFMKRPPRDRAALKEMFPRYRNDVLYRYVKREIARLLAEEGNEARAGMAIEIRI